MDFEIFPSYIWMFPDTSNGKHEINISTARNSCACCQMFLYALPSSVITWSFESTELSAPELFEILPVTVNKNSCFLEELDTERTSAEDMEKYYTKKAPFIVYDALKPAGEHFICKNEKIPLYLKWHISKETPPGSYSGCVKFSSESADISVPVRITISKAVVPDNKQFKMINWIEPNPVHYGYTPFSPKHWEVLKKLNRLACEAHQTHVNLNASFFYYKGTADNPEFCFERAKKYISLCMEQGCKYIEGPNLKTIYLNMYPNADESSFGSDRCLAFLKGFIEQWYTFLKASELDGITVQHIFDEPRNKNIHIYKKLGKLVKEIMPDVPTIDAVLTTDLDSNPDIVIPTTRFYQLHRDEFDKMISDSDKRRLWLYTCCWPSAPYLNRFLDMPLLSVRYIHWLCFKLNVSAYLHWGFCFQADVQDSYTEPSIPFKIFDDSLEQYLPPGDTNIVYPYNGEPLGSVRLEMQRAGIEDFELLSSLSRSRAEELTGKCITDDFTADFSPELFDEVYNELLDC